MKIELTIKPKKGGSSAIKKIIETDTQGSDFHIINQAKLKWLNDYISRDYSKPVNFMTLSGANEETKNAFSIHGKIINYESVHK